MFCLKTYIYTISISPTSNGHRYQQQAANGLRITGPMLQKQARHYAAHLGIINFAASNGWLANFRRFYNIISVTKTIFSVFLVFSWKAFSYCQMRSCTQRLH